MDGKRDETVRYSPRVVARRSWRVDDKTGWLGRASSVLSATCEGSAWLCCGWQGGCGHSQWVRASSLPYLQWWVLMEVLKSGPLFQMAVPQRVGRYQSDRDPEDHVVVEALHQGELVGYLGGLGLESHSHDSRQLGRLAARIGNVGSHVHWLVDIAADAMAVGLKAGSREVVDLGCTAGDRVDGRLAAQHASYLPGYGVSDSEPVRHECLQSELFAAMEDV